MRARAPRLCLERELFDEQRPKSLRGDFPDASNPELRASAPTVLMGDKSRRSSKVAAFFALSTHQQAIELANALLRQFAFRAYKHRTPDIIPAFNSAFPRTLHSVTCKRFAQALLDEMGLTQERCAADDDDMMALQLSPTCIRMRSQTGVDRSSAFELEREDTVLERLARHALRQFFAQCPGRHSSAQSDSPKVTNSSGGSWGSCNSSVGGGRDNRNAHSCEVQGVRENLDISSNEFNPPTACVPLRVEVGERATDALLNFLDKHPTEDERVFAVAAALLYQHVLNPYVSPLPTPIIWNMINEKDVDISHEGSLPSGAFNVGRTESSLCESKKDDFLKLGPEQLLLIDMLKGVQDDTLSWHALSVLLGAASGLSSLSLHWQSFESALGTTNPVRSSWPSAEIVLRSGGLDIPAGSETQDVCWTTAREKRQPLPSLLCLYLQSHLQKGLPSMESVSKRMMLIEQGCPQQSHYVSSIRESLSTVPFSLSQSQEPTSSVSSWMWSSGHSSSNIVSVHSMEGMSLIGRGSSGELFAMRRLDTGELVAVKRIYITEESRRHVEKEVSVLKRSIGLTGAVDGGRDGQSTTEVQKTLHERTTKGGDDVDDSDSETNDHRAVVRCYDIFFDGGFAFIVMELMDSGSLMDALNARHGRAFSENECCAITFQVLHGLRYLHDTVRQLHRDLKPHNILLDRRSGAVKLTDFGLSSNRLQSMGFNQCGTYVGTLAYMSPNRVDLDSVYGKESDFWSLGITLLQLALGRLPFTPNIFTIASFRTQPPRLPAAPACDGGASCESCGRNRPAAPLFSKAFQDFIAILLPAAHDKDSITPMYRAEEEESTPSCASTCPDPRDAAAAVLSGGDGGVADACGVVELPTWPSSRFLFPAPSPSRSPTPRRSGGPAEVTATGLLRHEWVRRMSWAESTAAVSAIALEAAGQTE